MTKASMTLPSTVTKSNLFQESLKKFCYDPNISLIERFLQKKRTDFKDREEKQSISQCVFLQSSESKNTQAKHNPKEE